MADLLSALIGNLGSTNDYLAQDPFFMGGRQVASWNLHPTTNAEAIYGPIVQGLLGGFLTGYGKDRALDAAYQDYSQNPLMASATFTNPYSSFIGPLSEEQQQTANNFDALHQYGLAERPEGWTPTTGRSDLLLAALTQQNQQAVEQKKADAQAELAKLFAGKGLVLTPEGVSTIPGYAEASAGLAGAEEGAKKAAGILADKTAGIRPEALSKLETDLTTKLTTGNEAQKTLQLQTKAKDVLYSLEKSDPIRAATAIYGFAKILDPEGVVRKEDGTIVADPGGPAGQLASLANSMMQKGRLTDQTKDAMKEIIPELVSNQYGTYKTLADSMINPALKQGALKENIGILPPTPVGPVITKQLKGGGTVQVQRLSDGSYAEVE